MTIKKLFKSTDGTFSIILATMLVAITTTIALAIDYSRLSEARASLQNKLDAAVLASVHADSEAEANKVLHNYFELTPPEPGSDGSFEKVTLSNYSVKLISYDSMEVVATARYTVPMTFAKVFGMDTVPVDVRAAATRLAGYQNLVFALDLSGSLGMGATEFDRAALGALTFPYTSNLLPPRASWYGSALPQGCAFACHRREGWEPGNKTVYEMAREAGIKLREDELISQFGGLTDLLLDPSDEMVQQGMRKVSVVAFSNTARTLISESTSPSAVKAVLNDFPKRDRFETVYANAFSHFNNILGTQGKGTESDPAKMLVLITDGIESRDQFYAQRAIDTALCEELKAKGFPLAVVELVYPVLENNYLYRDTVRPVKDQISPALQSCASPGWYFRAENNDQVPERFNELRTKFGTKQVRLSQ